MTPWSIARLTLFTALAVTAALESPGAAMLARLGGEFQVNSSSVGSHSVPRVTGLPDGGFFVVWRNDDAGESAVLGRRFSSGGTPVGPDLQVSSEPAFANTYPRVAASDSTLLVVWDSAPPWSIVGQFFDVDNVPLGEERVLSELKGSFGPAAAATEGGEFVVVWTEDSGYKARARRFAANGNPRAPSFAVGIDALGAGQYRASVAGGVDESFLVTWYAEPQVKVQGRFIEGNEPELPTFDVAMVRSISNVHPEICHRTGGFVLTWATDSPNSSSDRPALYRLYNEVGNATTAPVRVTAEQPNVNQNVPNVACGENDRFAIVWGERRAVKGRTFDAALHADFTIGHDKRSTLFEGPSVTFLSAGDLVVTWSDCTDETLCNVFAQRFTFSESDVCPGDCDGDGVVTVAELVQAVNVALAPTPEVMRRCLPVDTDLTYTVSVDELMKAVNGLLGGCQ